MMLKRTLDIILSFIGLLILCVPLVFLCVLIRFNLGSPILFSQTRPGLNSHPFRMYKLRSMTDIKNEHGELLPDNLRVTPFGSFLRASSIDEIPGLWSVLKGDMSLVGPRPLLMEYLALYSKEQVRRHNVKPGITGWAQINGRNAISWQEKFSLDIWYVDNQSFWLDIKILLLTVKKVLKKADISAQGEVTMHKFTGNKND